MHTHVRVCLAPGTDTWVDILVSSPAPAPLASSLLLPVSSLPPPCAAFPVPPDASSPPVLAAAAHVPAASWLLALSFVAAEVEWVSLAGTCNLSSHEICQL